MSGSNDWASSAEHLLGSKTLTVLLIDENFFRGAFPEALTYLPHLQELRLGCTKYHRGGLYGKLPDSLRLLKALHQVEASGHRFSSTLPTALCDLTALRKLSLFHNRFTGPLLPCLDRCTHLEEIAVYRNRLSGSIPENGLAQETLHSLQLGRNDFRGSIPKSIGRAKWLRLELYTSHLTGSIPDFLHLHYLQTFELGFNALTGRLPDSLSNASQLQSLEASYNALTGPFLSGVNYINSTYPHLRECLLLDNMLSGTIPDILAHSRRLQVLSIGGNMLQGTVPNFIGKELVHLGNLEIGRGHMGSQTFLSGPLPPSLSRCNRFYLLTGYGHKLEGQVPKFQSTFIGLILHENRLHALPDLHFSGRHGTVTKYIFMHRNQLSCRLPRLKQAGIEEALVAFGNYFQRPRNFPPWVKNYEKAGLFWCHAHEGTALVLKFSICALLLKSSLPRALRNYRNQGNLGQVGALLNACRSLCSTYAVFGLRSFIVLALVLDQDFYLCPGILAKASTCLSRSGVMHIMVVASWYMLAKEAARPWWLHAESRAKAAKRALQSLRSSSMRTHSGGMEVTSHQPLQVRVATWLFWFVLVTLLSLPSVFVVVSKSVPLFLGLSELLVQLIGTGAGLFQSMVSSILIPRLGDCLIKNLQSSRRDRLISYAHLHIVCLVPCACILVLDGLCIGGWTHWWRPCAKYRERFHVLAGRFDGYATLLHPNDICQSVGWPVPSRCVRNIVKKMQQILLGKLMCTSMLIPACRLYCEQFQNSQHIVGHLATSLYIGLALGTFLPLTAPMLLLSALTCHLLSCAAFDRGSFAMKRTQGIAKVGIVLALLVSFCFHLAFVYEDALATVVLAFFGLRVLRNILFEGWPQIRACFQCRSRLDADR
mmetsp:Transcript_15649/g.35184  ORF Transcript_15649/g.35184 Transcript_15649/m.35184 type:complete len:880 (+) Transcript_15649:127-2766(+)